MRSALLLALVAIIGIACVVNAGQTCLDENGDAVDWFMIVKLPRLVDSGIPGVEKGTSYLYGDANSYADPSSFWSNSSSQITDSDSSAGQTIQQIYDGSSDSTNGWLMYNDETPSGTTSMSYGHTKGMLSWSKSGGFWLIHSVPKYSESPDNGASNYAYPSTGEEYGQSMLCITMDVANIDKAFLQMEYTNPQVYGSQWVSALTSQMPNGDDFMNNNVVIKTASSKVTNVTSVGGVTWTHFAKTVAWGKSIYGDLIGPFYHQNMVVETWQRPYEQPLIPPTTTDAVYSVLDLQTPYYAFDQTTWKESQDHAKWGLSTDSATPLICIGDINKQMTQWQRSGGMACILDKHMFNAFSGLVTKTDQGGVDIAFA